ncbi:adenylyl-sulfate kinase [Pectinatus brassicae]|uniref:Adenylyl-sulfate kinase n=1 Tax=Pectinatus brassicae TaxID=862415 RepID=A0A840UWS6_9FIRM|nr:adenylyl-sulfate kinase [Pectinatus brassicae]MBB5336845.1 bifunctional enzyme CysN/CysC [Pectinatus brassicae]
MTNRSNSLLKFITCGSVDDGKSTLIGHMLYDAKLLFADQKRALELDSRIGSNNGEIDYSLLLDGLMAEREQGITIDVAYRYFTTEKRSFIVADTPGHEEYTRNMAVGASFADLAIILIDVTKGVLPQTKRHTRICAFMGIKHVVFVINKMDLVSYNKSTFADIKLDIRKLTAEFEFLSQYIIPVSATKGDNINTLAENMKWYTGSPLLDYLENIEINQARENQGFLMPVQRVVRPDHTFRGFQGQIEVGNICTGDEITVYPSRETAKISSLFLTDKKVEQVQAGQAATIQLDQEIDISRGCVLANNFNIEVSNAFVGTLLWMDDQELITGRNYFLKIGTNLVPATIMRLKYKIDINTGKHVSAEHIYKNEFVVCEIILASKIGITSFLENKELGAFILIDRITNMTSACGTITNTLRRGTNLSWQKLDINRDIRAKQLGQKPVTIWFTGLSGSGKSTLANALEKQLVAMGRHTMLLDGDNIRLGLNKNLGFTHEDRVENIRRIAETGKLMNDAGLIVLTSFISPYREDRENARNIIGQESFIEIFVDTPLEECEKRDVKGLYKKARNGEIPNFTGITSPYEKPLNADIKVNTVEHKIEEIIAAIIEKLKQTGVLKV